MHGFSCIVYTYHIMTYAGSQTYSKRERITNTGNHKLHVQYICCIGFLLYLFIFYFHVNDDDDDDDDGHLYCAGNPCYSTHSSMLSAHWPPSQEGAGSQYKQTSNTNKQTKQTNTMIVLLSSCLLFCLRRSTCILFSLSRR